MKITAGGAVSNTSGYIGLYGGAASTVTVDGAGSTWTNNGGLYVGYDNYYSGSSSLNITNGGAVTDTSGYIGFYSGLASTVAVDGAGSTWTNSGELYVGFYDYYGGSATLNITNGGTVSNTNGYVSAGADGRRRWRRLKVDE